MSVLAAQSSSWEPGWETLGERVTKYVMSQPCIPNQWLLLPLHLFLLGVMETPVEEVGRRE